MGEGFRSTTTTLTIRLEGWRSLGHSYSIVQQWHALELSRRACCRIGMRDLPTMPRWVGPRWEPIRGIFDPADEARLSEFGDVAMPDVVVRMVFPVSFRSEPPTRSFVFAPGDFGWCPRALIEDGQTLQEAHAGSDVVLLTPSRWSAWGLRRAGADPRRLAVVPHGVAPQIFYPAPDDIRKRLRERLDWQDKFIFLNVSAMTPNKGTDILLKAFSRVAERFPNVRLALKGSDQLYRSELHLRNTIRLVLSQEEWRSIRGRIWYYDATWPFRRLASLYQAADCYVTPYRNEGFNLPALEAVASGLPVICTAGGPTDDFMPDECAFKIPAQIIKKPNQGRLRDAQEVMLEPDADHLCALMEAMIGDCAVAEYSRLAGPAHVRAQFTWQHAVDRLLEVIACYR